MAAPWPKSVNPYPSAMVHYVLLVLNDEEVLGVMPLPNGPAQLTIAEEFASSIDFTLGAAPKREHSEPRSWAITLAGRTGTVPRAWRSKKGTEDDTSKTIPLQPLAILQDFNEFLDWYQTLARNDGARMLSSEPFAFDATRYVRLRLACLKENRRFHVELRKFTYDRNAATSRNSAEWLLQLEAWEDIGTSSRIAGSRARFASAKSTGGSVSLGRGAAGWRASPWVQQHTPEVARELFLQQAVALDGREAHFTSLGERTRRAVILARMKTIIASDTPGSGSFLAGLYAALMSRDPFDAVARGLAPARQYTEAFGRLPEALSRWQGLGDVPANTLRELHAAATALAFALGVGASIDGPQPWAAAGSYAGAEGVQALMAQFAMFAAAEAATILGLQGIKVWAVPDAPADSAGYQLPAGVASWQDLSQLLYKTPTFWLALAALNNAKDAYSDANGAPLLPGKQVLVPFSNGVPNTGAASDALFGADFLDGPDGDWVLQGDDSVASVKGVANLRQALYNRSVSVRGQVPSWPAYGVPRAGPGEPITAQSAAWSALDVQEQLLRDPRVADVTGVSVELQGDGWLVKYTAIPMGPQPEKFTALVPAALI